MQNEINALKLRLSAMEARLAVLESGNASLPAPVHSPVGIQPDANSRIAQAVEQSFHLLHGRMTTTDVALAVGLPTDHSTLVRIGKHMSALNVEKIMTNAGGRFVFSPAAHEAEGGQFDRVNPVDWLRGATAHCGASLAGVMTAMDVLKALGLSHATSRLATVCAAAKALGLKEVPAGAERAFDFGQGIFQR